MAVPLKTVDFVGGRINETPVGSTTVEILKLKDTLASATETIHDNVTLGPLVSGIVNIGNVSTAKVLALIGSDTFNASINGNPAIPFKTFVAFGTTVTSLTIINPSASDTISVEVYGATDTT